MFFALIESRKDKWDERRGILADQVDNPVVVPEVQCSLSHLTTAQDTSVSANTHLVTLQHIGHVRVSQQTPCDITNDGIVLEHVCQLE